MFKNTKKKSKGRQIVNSVKTKIDGIEFDSKLEAYMYSILKKNNIDALYEGKTYTIIEPFLFKGENYEKVRKTSDQMTVRNKVLKMEYTPDFVHPNEDFIIEVKGRANESFPLRWKMFKKSLNDQNKKIMLFKPSTVKDCDQIIEILKNKGYGY